MQIYITFPNINNMFPVIYITKTEHFIYTYNTNISLWGMERFIENIYTFFDDYKEDTNTLQTLLRVMVSINLALTCRMMVLNSK